MSEGDKTLSEMADLEDLFACARQARPALPSDLQATILADAHMMQRDQSMVTPGTGSATDPSTRPQRLWRQFTAAIGGWPALGGLAAASLVGLWLGLAPPVFLPDPVAGLAAASSAPQLLADLDYDVSFLMSDEVFE